MARSDAYRCHCGVPSTATDTWPDGTPKIGANGICELCRADRITPWFHEDEHCWVAECEICAVPMVVWRQHGTDPPEEVLVAMLRQLTEVAVARFGEGQFGIDRHMRQIPDHFHAHARPFRRST